MNLKEQSDCAENGACGTKVDEPLTILQFCGVKWVAPKVDPRELAYLRFKLGKTERELARYFGCSKTAIHKQVSKLKNEQYPN